MASGSSGWRPSSTPSQRRPRGPTSSSVAPRSAKFVAGFPGIGFSIDSGGTYFLPKVLGPRRALELILTGKTLDAEEALGWGLVHRVVDDGELLRETEHGRGAGLGARDRRPEPDGDHAGEGVVQRGKRAHPGCGRGRAPRARALLRNG